MYLSTSYKSVTLYSICPLNDTDWQIYEIFLLRELLIFFQPRFMLTKIPTFFSDIEKKHRLSGYMRGYVNCSPRRAFFFFVLLGNRWGEYYRGLIILCFAFEFRHCFQPTLPCGNQKSPPAFQTVDWQGILDIFISKNKGNRAMQK